MAALKLTPNLMVNAVRESAAFYQGLLGLELTACVDEAHQFHTSLPAQGAPLWAMFSANGAELLMIQEQGNLAQDVPVFAGASPGGTFTLYLETDNLDELYARLESRVTTVKPLGVTFYGMREWYIKDPDGYVVCLAQKA